MEKDFKRSKRRFNTYLYVKKQVNIYKLYNDSIPSVIGKQKKQAALNCGHPKCTMCGNPRKFFGYVTLKEEASKKLLKDGINEYYQGAY